jgi:hypothetical protein
MSTDLREELDALARTQTFSPDPSLWDRGRRARRRGQVLAVAAVLAILASVGGAATLVSTDRELRTASGEEVPGGAIPSRIVDPGKLDAEEPTVVGRASVAFVSEAGQPVVVDAVDGSYHALDLTGFDGSVVSLSPDGRRLAWSTDATLDGRLPDGFEVVDLASGEIRLVSAGSAGIRTPGGVSWSPSSQWLTWFVGDTVSRTAIDPTGVVDVETSEIGKRVEWSAIGDDGVVTFYAGGPRQWQTEGAYQRMRMSDGTRFDGTRDGRDDGAVASPGGGTVALSSTSAGPADFLEPGRFEARPLAADLYPEGAVVRPLGWATDGLVLAQVDAPAGSYVVGTHLALFSSPDVPEQQWTYRIVARDVVDRPLSIAVDLVPDLDGTSSQVLTHDFGDVLVRDQRDISWIIGLGVAAAIGVLLGLRRLWRRLMP